jgi:hypothetical protein
MQWLYTMLRTLFCYGLFSNVLLGDMEFILEFQRRSTT